VKLAELALLTDENIDREVVAYLRAREFAKLKRHPTAYAGSRRIMVFPVE